MKCPFFNVSIWRRAHCRSAFVAPDTFHSSTSFFVSVEDLYRRSFAPSQVNMKCSFSESGLGSFFKAHLTQATHAMSFSYTRQFANCSKKVLDAERERTNCEKTDSQFSVPCYSESYNLRCLGMIANFPMARASAVVVHNTSVSDMLRNILCPTRSRSKAWSLVPRNRAGMGCRRSSNLDCGGSK
jgi:hypothetical protein